MTTKKRKLTAKVRSLAAHVSALDSRLMHALKTDGAIRVFDGRWSLGFVDETALNQAIASGQLRTQQRHGMTFAVLPNAEHSNTPTQNP
jgi:hypothetical protein